MYGFVIFGESSDKHTRHYLYKLKESIKKGNVVIVPAKASLKMALVHSTFASMPCDCKLKEDQIKEIQSVYKNIIEIDKAKSFFLALIDEYKDGRIKKEELYDIIESFVNTNQINFENDSLFKNILCTQLLDGCLFYVDEPSDTGEKELGFWKELKDIEYKLRYGYSFKESATKRHFNLKSDSVEYTDKYLKIELELEKTIRKESGDCRFCHQYWNIKKKILYEKYGIDWKSPVELNPTVRFD